MPTLVWSLRILASCYHFQSHTKCHERIFVRSMLWIAVLQLPGRIYGHLRPSRYYTITTVVCLILASRFLFDQLPSPKSLAFSCDLRQKYRSAPLQPTLCLQERRMGNSILLIPIINLTKDNNYKKNQHTWTTPAQQHLYFTYTKLSNPLAQIYDNLTIFT